MCVRVCVLACCVCLFVWTVVRKRGGEAQTPQCCIALQCGVVSCSVLQREMQCVAVCCDVRCIELICVGV